MGFLFSSAGFDPLRLVASLRSQDKQAVGSHGQVLVRLFFNNEYWRNDCSLVSKEVSLTKFSIRIDFMSVWIKSM